MAIDLNFKWLDPSTIGVSKIGMIRLCWGSNVSVGTPSPNTTLFYPQTNGDPNEEYSKWGIRKAKKNGLVLSNQQSEPASYQHK